MFLINRATENQKFLFVCLSKSILISLLNKEHFKILKEAINNKRMNTIFVNMFLKNFPSYRFEIVITKFYQRQENNIKRRIIAQYMDCFINLSIKYFINYHQIGYHNSICPCDYFMDFINEQIVLKEEEKNAK